jgi:hypothetical protein
MRSLSIELTRIAGMVVAPELRKSLQICGSPPHLELSNKDLAFCAVQCHIHAVQQRRCCTCPSWAFPP